MQLGGAEQSTPPDSDNVREENEMLFLSDRRGIVAVEYIVIGAISLIVIAAAIWQLAGSIAGRLVDFNNGL